MLRAWDDAQADAVLSRGAGDAALDVNCGGEGPLSAEWMLPKVYITVM